MSVNKLLKRIVTPEIAAQEMSGAFQEENLALHLHDYTYGINSDPLAMFAMTFSALIHGEQLLVWFSLSLKFAGQVGYIESLTFLP